jgi:nucleotide-binding universal stress UspA family protein
LTFVNAQKFRSTDKSHKAILIILIGPLRVAVYFHWNFPAMKRILVPCDFSECAQNAYTFALDIAKKTNGELFVIHAIDLPFIYDAPLYGIPYMVDTNGLMTELENVAKENFRKMKSSHSVQHDISFEVCHGPVTATIRKFIDDHQIDLVVMGTKGANGLSEILIGSNTEKVVRYSPVPVVAVRKAVNLSSIQNIVFPTSLEPDQDDLISDVKELQAFFDARLHLLVINTPHNLKRAADETSLVKDHARKHGLENYTINIREDFDEQAGILDFVLEIHGDMIAMGTHGRKGLSHLFRGSIAEDVVNHVDVPVWTHSIAKHHEIHR